MHAVISDEQRTANAIRFLDARGYKIQKQKQQEISNDYLTRKQVEFMTTLSKSTIYSLMKEGKFPINKKISSNRTVWFRSEIESFMQAKN